MRLIFGRSLLFLLTGLAVLYEGAGCKSGEVGLDIAVPRDLVDATVWFEIGAFKESTCAAVTPMLGNGIPESATARVAFRRADEAAPKFGDIPNAEYAFAAVARDENCGVLAVGCTEVEADD